MKIDSTTDLTERNIATKRIFDGQMISLRVDTVTLPNGGTATREVIEHPGAVAVVALTEAGELLMVRQYRYPIGDVLLEIPAGQRDRGETPLVCARRELEEETGYRAQKWQLLFSYYSAPGFTDELLYMLLATDLEPGEPHTDEEEFIEVVKVPLAEAVRMAERGEIRDSKTLIGIHVLHRMQSDGASYCSLASQP